MTKSGSAARSKRIALRCSSRNFAKFPAGIKAGRSVVVLAPRCGRRRAWCCKNFGAAKKFGERQQRGAFHGIGGTLRIGIECADGFDRVAEKLDANGLRRFGRENVDDAAANGELSRHLAGDLLFVAGAERKSIRSSWANGFVALDRASQIAIEIAVAHAPQRRLYGRDHQIGFARSQSPERDGAIFGNFRVRRAIFVGQNVVGGKMYDASAGFRGDGAVKPAERLEQFFGALIGVHEQDDGATEFAKNQRDEDRFCGVGETGEGNFGFLAAKFFAALLNRCEARDSGDEFGNERENHARTRPVEWVESVKRCWE